MADDEKAVNPAVDGDRASPPAASGGSSFGSAAAGLDADEQPAGGTSQAGPASGGGPGTGRQPAGEAGDDPFRPDRIVNTLIILDDIYAAREAVGNIPTSLERLGCSIPPNIVANIEAREDLAKAIRDKFADIEAGAASSGSIPMPTPDTTLTAAAKPRDFDIRMVIARTDLDGRRAGAGSMRVLFRCRVFFSHELLDHRPGPIELDEIFKQLEAKASGSKKSARSLRLIYAITDFEAGDLQLEGRTVFGVDRIANAGVIAAMGRAGEERNPTTAVALAFTGFERVFAEFSHRHETWGRYPSALGAAIDPDFVRGLLFETLKQREHLLHQMHLCLAARGNLASMTITMVMPYGFLKNAGCANWNPAADDGGAPLAPRKPPPKPDALRQGPLSAVSSDAVNRLPLAGEHDEPVVIPMECATPLIAAALGIHTPFQLTPAIVRDMALQRHSPIAALF